MPMKKILVIEDDPTINLNIKEALMAEGFAVDVLFDGLMADKQLRKEQYDCVVLDLNLPHKNGYEVCRQFRQYNTHTPVFMLTAFGELDDKVMGYESGADDYLTKPFYMKELIMKVQSLIKRSETNSPGGGAKHLVAGDVVIDTALKKVTRQDQEIILTPREYQILCRLMESKNEVVPKKELIREIWGSSVDANTNTIEVYINFLRNKIDRPFGTDSIRTKVGFGYYFHIA